MAQRISALPVLAKVRDIQTTYYDAVIDWVIGDKNHEGYPENSVTLISEHILTLKCFDGKESGGDNLRISYGNNRYRYSNIRQWMNKKGAEWYVPQHDYDLPPAKENIWNGRNAYDTEDGFKTGFSDEMLAAIIPTTLISAIPYIDGGGYETVIDDIFLLSMFEVNIMSGSMTNLEKDIKEGSALAMFSDDESRKCVPTPQAISKSEYDINGSISDSRPWWVWWLRTPRFNSSSRTVYIDGSTSDSDPFYENKGVRPALNISSNVLVSDTPDAEGYYTIIWNGIPANPPHITLPDNIQGGGTIGVQWERATDPEGDPIGGYELERQVDGGDWTQVYKGEATSYTDTITRGWLTVAYRVRAYDSFERYSDYTTSPTREVNNNRAPAIVCTPASGSDLGVKGEGFTVSYSATDADGDPVTVTESIDGVTLRTFTPEAEEACTFALTGETWMKILNGAHELAITASDGQAQAVHTLTFTKSVTAASVTLAQPMEADGPITLCVLSVTGSIPEDADYSVKVTNNALDDAPVWEDCTDEVRLGANHVFTNDTAANGFAFNFLVSVERGESGQGGYINSVQGGFQ